MAAMPGRDEYDSEMKQRNFLRAAAIAEQGSLGEAALDDARRQAFKQLLGEWFNFRAAETVAREWGFGRSDIETLCAEIVAGVEDRQAREERELQVFDIGRMDHTPVAKLVIRFRDRFR